MSERCRVTDELDAWEREQDRLERAEEYEREIEKDDYKAPEEK